MTTTMATTSSPASSSHPVGLPKGPSTPRLHKLLAVPGCKPDMLNDLLLLRPGDGQDSQASSSSSSCKHVVFFHGDIQNFREEMASQSDCAQWLQWSLEQVVITLGRRFPGHHVWVVRASRMYLHKFSSYCNFVESNMFGAPEHAPYSPDGGALSHLRSLLINGMERAGLQNTIQHPDGAPSTAFSLTLVGFSKGCVVLNQVLYELGGAQADPHLADFTRSLSDMFWLDGGHPGGSETWVTDKRLLGQLAASGIGIHTHVTPYEVRDPMRAWVGREHACFVKTLEELGARLYDKLHFEDEPPSIENHFRVIQEF
ncbi:mitochondrial protein C2orf69 homolog [Corythoichthys intestinalis]|uniref:mitochondrial protein C2orf69 homolog n=1 Tax=Corythoichthys intestinalis TaxID=161448 RepID=UPI0025A54AE6|nr:mitochondrial protein C2orf69 homolog [Corythoichthys intestinalis]XP_057709283.1 mitochondrial protein C2orf69 homolog [Corythoichthys intestinalis]XP_061799683.1 mitochondrial protein C2orf69 homolog [Nerophis lumbriciformis]